jgi:hypothetical protein
MALLGIGVSVAGAAISVYLYNPTAERVPTFVIDPVRTPIVSSKFFPDSALKVTRANNLPIQGDVTAVRISFWNDGKQSIKPDNILQGLTLTLNDVNGEILDYKVLKVSRPDVVKIVLKASDKNPARDLMLEFNILEKDDGFTCQIIYEGDPSAALTVFGVVEGVKTIKSNETLTGDRVWKEMRRPIFIIVLIVGPLIIWNAVSTVFRIARWRENLIINADKSVKYYVARFIPHLSLVVLFVTIILMLFVALAREYARANIMEAVPQSIRP